MEHLSHENEEDLLFKGENIHCRKEPLFEGWGDSFLYSGYFKNANDPKEEIAVRKIKKTDCCDQWEDIFIKHTREKDPIKHDNVLKIIGYEEKDEWRFFALESYDATLEQFCKGIYKGPMPSEAQVLCQITKGLLYLHIDDCSHGKLTPQTILIASSQPVRMMIKLSEFGLSKLSDQCDEELGEEHELCKRKYWILDETTDSNQQTPTLHQDIFAAGCLCFYFLKRGVHPFGDNAPSIINNIKERNPVNLLKTIQQEKDIWEFAYEPIKNMIGNPRDPTLWLLRAKKSFKKARSLKVNEQKVLGEGTFGIVHPGTFEGNAVAVKVFKFERKEEQKREMEEHFRLDHENVLKLFHLDELRDKPCLVLELCAGTLKNYCEKKYNGPELPPDGVVLYQIANGLHYIHSQNLVHRDVKPDNILISMTTPVQMKLSDFGFVKKTSPQGSYTQSVLKGTLKWMAPEILEHWMNNTSTNDLPHGTIQSDTFAAGCVFFYVATRGRHPFEQPTEISKQNTDGNILANILKNKPVEFNKRNQNLQGDVLVLYELIGDMIKPIGKRILLPDVINKLTTNLTASRQFKRVARLVRERGGNMVTRFHPKKLVLACGIKDEIIFFSADNSSIPFSNWKEEENKFQIGHVKGIRTMEWNADGNQLAAVSYIRDITVWSYPSGEILLQKNLNEWVNRIEWNPFRPNAFAAYLRLNMEPGKVFFFNSCPVDQRPFHFHTIEIWKRITSVKWISENRVALGFCNDGGIEIWKIDESTKSAKIVQRFQHVDGEDWIHSMVWDERTKCLAACSHYGWIKIWSMDSDQPIHATKVHGCYSFAWRPNGKQTNDAGVDAARKLADNFILAISGFGGGKIVIWTPLAEEKKRFLSQNTDWATSLSFSPDGRFLASADPDQKLIILSTENWKSADIDEEERSVGRHFSWLSSSTDVPDYKLTFKSSDGKVHVVEYAVGHSEKPSKDGMNEYCQGITKNIDENSIGSSGDLK